MSVLRDLVCSHVDALREEENITGRKVVGKYVSLSSRARISRRRGHTARAKYSVLLLFINYNVCVYSPITITIHPRKPWRCLWCRRFSLARYKRFSSAPLSRSTLNRFSFLFLSFLPFFFLSIFYTRIHTHFISLYGKCVAQYSLCRVLCTITLDTSIYILLVNIIIHTIYIIYNIYRFDICVLIRGPLY